MSQYQVGGSLSVSDCAYVVRAADTQLDEALSQSDLKTVVRSSKKFSTNLFY